MHVRRLLCAPSLATLALLAACDPPTYVTEERQLGIEDPALVVPPTHDPEAPAEVLAGTRMCPELAGWYEDDDARSYHTSDADGNAEDGWLAACFVLAGENATTPSDGCFEFDAPGAGAITFTPKACDAVADADFVRDRLAVDVHDAAVAQLRYDDVMRWVDEVGSPGPAESFPAVPPEPADGLHAIAGNRLHLDLIPFDGDVALAYSGATLGTTGAHPPASIDTALGSLAVTPAMGDAFAATLSLPVSTLTGPDITVVEASEARSLEIAVVYAACEDCEGGYDAPMVAVPLIADAAGKRLHGADVSWTIEGEDATLALDDAGRVSESSGDAAGLDTCKQRDGKHHEATLRASFAGLEASAQLSYDCVEPGSGQGCSCEIGDDRPTIAPLFAGLVLAWLGRRRRPSARLGRATGRSPMIAS